MNAAIRLVFPAIVALACLAGCGRSKLPPLGRVAGTVTLDGVPLPAALVAMAARPRSLGVNTTSAAGHYELAFLRDIAGANVGSHSVRITTATEDRGGKEILPARYHRKTELVATVEPGDNTLDFPLKSR